jgi:NCAIR mutase (PurE)-related protein
MPRNFHSLARAHREALDYDDVSRTAFLGKRQRPAGPARIAILTGGSSDVAVSREAARTLEYYGQRASTSPTSAWRVSGGCSTGSTRSGRCAW